METLNTHNHFAPAFGPEIIYNSRYDYSGKKSQKKPFEERCLNIPEQSQVKGQDKAGGKDNTSSIKNVNKDVTNKTIYSSQEEETFDKVHPPQSCEPPRTAVSSAELLKDSFETDLSTVADPDFGEREFFTRCVLIGAKSTGKHELINANFSEDKKGIPHEGTGVNFINKSKTNFKTTRKYHFWINSLDKNASEVKEAIWKTYYKYSMTFVFVYDTTNKKSFEALEKAVKSVLEVVPKEQFFGILLGTKNDLKDQREVNYEDISNFVAKYNFKYFTETNSEQEKTSSQLLPRVNANLKCTFEAI